MAVKIGHASLGSNGKINGDIAGDQNKKEVTTRQWYSKPWSVMLRPISDEVAENSAQACEKGCANDNIGYNQSTRNTAHTQAKKVGYDLSKISVPCETDCSAFMTLCAIAAGVTELEYSGNSPTTSTMVDAFVKTGKYKKYTDSKYLTTDKYLKRGDILVKPGSHTVMSLENGSEADTAIPQKQSNISLTYPCRGIDISKYQKDLNYEVLKQNGCKFSIIKIVDKQLQKEPEFETHYNGCINAGISVLGVYQYSYAQTIEKAHIDAQAVIKALNGRKVPVVIDVEDNCQKNLGHLLVDIINAYQKSIESAGLPFYIYSGYSFVKSYIIPYLKDLKCKNFWIARYYKSNTPMGINEQLDDSKKPTVQGINLIGWQFTSNGIITGSQGRLDCNIFYQKPNSVSTSTQTWGIVSANVLNVRDLPSTKGKIVGALKKGETVHIYGIDPTTGWYKLGENEYASNQYITKI